MNKTESFYALIRQEMAATLATAAEGRVTMRLISPVYADGRILLFTSPASVKYRQLIKNPLCCLSIGPFFAECRAACLGAAMREENAPYRALYREKFPDAFDPDAVFGGKDADFFLLTPIRLSGWGFENDVPTADGVPTVPFSIDLEAEA